MFYFLVSSLHAMYNAFGACCRYTNGPTSRAMSRWRSSYFAMTRSTLVVSYESTSESAASTPHIDFNLNSL